MKVSLEWLADYVALPAAVSAEDLARELTLKTVEVEGTERTGGDVVLEIDNKSLTNRPDLWGHYGIARELAAIYQAPLAPLADAIRPPEMTGLVAAPDPELCTRFVAVAFTADPGGPTPELIRRRLARVGADSISLLVDLANYVMFATGQPLHVYDAGKLRLPLRVAIGEVPAGFELLTGQRAGPAAGVPVICDEDGVAAIAGVMGGARTAVTGSSVQFVLESATFRPRLVRNASQRLNLRTEASARFEKGLDTQRAGLGADLFLGLLREAAPQAVITGIQDAVIQPTAPAEIDVSRAYLDRRVGEPLDGAETDRTLLALGFQVRHEPGTPPGHDLLHVTAPTWRSTGDVSQPEDILEEVARIRGYDTLPVAQTRVALNSARTLHLRSVDRMLREQAALRAGLREVITYPWTSDDLLTAAGLDKTRATRFSGASSPDRDSLRPALLPNLMEAIQANLRYQPSFGIFEVGIVFPGGHAVPYRAGYEPAPPMRRHMALALTGADGTELFRRLKGILTMLRQYCQLATLTLHGDTAEPWADPSARLAINAEGTAIGGLGLLTPRTRRLAGIGGTQVAYAELDITALPDPPSRDGSYTPLPDLPDSEFDLSLIVSDDVEWARIEQVAAAADPLINAITYIGEYRGNWVPDGHRSLSLRATLRPRDATLTAAQITGARDAILEALAKQFDAHLR